MQRVLQSACSHRMTSSCVHVSTKDTFVFVFHDDALNTAQTEFIVTWNKTQLHLKMTTLLADTKSSFSKENKSKMLILRFHCEYPDCQKSYTTKGTLADHVSSYHENRGFRCKYPDCLKSYTDKRTLENHVSSYHENRRFKCEYLNCQKSYTTKQNLELHVSSYHENRGFRCEYPDCQKSYTTKSNLCKHVLREHAEAHKRFETIAVLETHIADIDSQIETVAALISGFDSFECDECFF